MQLFFCFDHEIYDITNSCENRQKKPANGICFSLHVMSIFILLLLLLLSVNLLSADLLTAANSALQ